MDRSAGLTWPDPAQHPPGDCPGWTRGSIPLSAAGSLRRRRRARGTPGNLLPVRTLDLIEHRVVTDRCEVSATRPARPDYHSHCPPTRIAAFGCGHLRLGTDSRGIAAPVLQQHDPKTRSELRATFVANSLQRISAASSRNRPGLPGGGVIPRATPPEAGASCCVATVVKLPAKRLAASEQCLKGRRALVI